MRSLRNAALAAFAALAAATGAGAANKPSSLPIADPSAVLGEPYTADGVTYIPADAPFDDVGYAGLDTAAGPGVSIAHRTLPLPSYVEVTALDSGRTILAQVERRGPTSGKTLVLVSAAGFAQLGADSTQPLAVRVRRVNPQEYERALLRTNQRAPERLVTPGPLLGVLRKLLANKSALPAAGVGDRVPVAVVPVAAPPIELAVGKPVVAKPAPAKASPAKPVAAPASGGFTVQVGSFASKPNADATAKRLGGKASAAGQLWRVRIGPFASRASAEAGLASAKKAGFGDARIVASAR